MRSLHTSSLTCSSPATDSVASLYSLDRDGLLGHDRSFGAQLDLVLVLSDVRAGQGGIPIGVGDRLPLQPDLLVADRNGRAEFSVTTYLRSRARPAGTRPSRRSDAPPNGHRTVGVLALGAAARPGVGVTAQA